MNSKSYETDTKIKVVGQFLRVNLETTQQQRGSNRISYSVEQEAQDGKEVTDCGGGRMRVKR